MDNKCMDCGIKYPHLQRANIIARHKGGTNDLSNIVWICPNCHHLRDRADRVGWVKNRWEGVSPEQRSEDGRARMAAMNPEQKAARGAKISRAKFGKKHPEGHKTGGARKLTPEQLEKRAEAVRATYATWTPEKRAEHAAKISAAKRAKAGAKD